MGRKLWVGLLWLVALVGALGTVFFVWMLLTPGYGDPVIGVVAAVCVSITVAAAVPLQRRRRRRRAGAAASRPPVGGDELELLRPGRRRWTLIAASAGLFVALTIWLQLRDGLHAGILFSGLLFATGLVVAVLQLTTGVSWMRITTEGIVVRRLGRVRTYRWEDVDNFRTYDVNTRYTSQRFVGWDSCNDAPPGVHRSKLSRVIAGVDDGLPDTYGEDADELAERLQRYRRQYAGRRRQRDDGRSSQGRVYTSTA